MHVESLLSHYGLPAVLLLATVEGDLTLILAGVGAHVGLFRLDAAILAGAAGNFLGDCVWYLIGRSHSQRLSDSRFFQRVAPTVDALVRRLGLWELFVARIVYGTRNASMVFWGLRGLPWGRFAAMDLLGCAFWSLVLVLLGFLLSNSAAALIGEVRRIEVWLLGAVVAAALLVYLINRSARRRLGIGRRSSERH